eukprot:scaffold34167_cov70-Phaeocystis_antarctica.AAC.6
MRPRRPFIAVPTYSRSQIACGPTICSTVRGWYARGWYGRGTAEAGTVEADDRGWVRPRLVRVPRRTYSSAAPPGQAALRLRHVQYAGGRCA